jgi:cell division protein FtsQ
MWSSKKILIILTLIVLLVGIGAGLYTDSKFLIVNTISIAIDKNEAHKSVQKNVHDRIMSKLSSFKKVNILSVPIDRIQQHILSDVWVDSVILERKYPDQLKVNVRLKKVVFVYLDKRGRFLPVSVQGQLLNPVEPEHVPDVPLVRNSEIIKNPELLKQILALYAEIPREGVFSQKTIAEVDWTKSVGLIVESADVDGGRIVLGKERVQLKASRVKNVLKYLESQKQKWRVIDASFTKKVLVRLRKHS